MDVHISGHSNAASIKEIIKQIQPDFFLPVYANHYFLKEAAKLAMQAGISKDKIFVLDNGSIIEFQNKTAKVLNKKVDTSYVFVDGLGIGDIGHIVLRDRQLMAEDGMFVIIAIIDSQTGKIKGEPDIISRGFVYMKGSQELLERARKKIKEVIARSVIPGTDINWVYLRNNLRDKIGQFLYSKTKRRPMILPVIVRV